MLYPGASFCQELQLILVEDDQTVGEEAILEDAKFEDTTNKHYVPISIYSVKGLPKPSTMKLQGCVMCYVPGARCQVFTVLFVCGGTCNFLANDVLSPSSTYDIVLGNGTCMVTSPP